MPSYVVSGVSRGLGFALLGQLSSDPDNLVIGLVRDVPSTLKRVADEYGSPSNVHILHGDLEDHESLRKAAAETSRITGGSLDYLIANATYLPTWDAFDPISVLAKQEEKFASELTKLYTITILGNTNLVLEFIPLILKGNVKKVVLVSSGHSDLKLANNVEIPGATLYALTKAGLNILTSKFSAEYKKDGVLFVSICPGMVDTGVIATLDEKQKAYVMALGSRFAANIPDFKIMTPDESMRNMIGNWEKASLENGDAGVFLSHRGARYLY